MGKYRIDYKLMGYGNFYVEAPSVALAFEELYQSFQADNSLIVHAKYPYGFEILDGVEHKGDLPEKSKIRVTTREELRALRGRDELDEVTVTLPPKFADTNLFDFNHGSELS